MLVAQDHDKQRYYANEINYLFAKKITSENKLICPVCNHPVYHAGKETLGVKGRQRAHFRHKPGSSCTHGTGETYEHVTNKLHVYNWLKQKYPNYQVELEYRIAETNQIADVFLMLPNGDKIVFELQCSVIPVITFLDRHKKYKDCGIQDIWIFGENFYTSYSKTMIIPRNAILEILHKEHQEILLLDYNTKELRWVGQRIIEGKTSDRTEFEFDIEQKSVSEMLDFCYMDFSIAPYKINCEKYHRNQKLRKLNRSNWAKELLALRDISNAEKRNLRAAKQKERERKRKELEEQQKNRNIYINNIQTVVKSGDECLLYKKYLNTFSLQNEMYRMTDIEKRSFEVLIRKHNITTVNFPGICKVKLPNSKKINTPFTLWQLWIIDQILSHYQNKSLTINNLYFKMTKTNIFNIENQYQREVKECLEFYLNLLEEVGILKHRCTDKFYEPFPVLIRTIPLLNNFKINSYVAFFHSVYSLRDDEHYERAENANQEYKMLIKNNKE
ncbi:competence protein CoiA [Lysinibacillus sp. NPDC093216]|uniref:competence protein CoiA n=1 Tax=Lysinibacillus sp. NPDC093216 TaxID=3390576 RepID=UPI003D07A2C0